MNRDKRRRVTFHDADVFFHFLTKWQDPVALVGPFEPRLIQFLTLLHRPDLSLIRWTRGEDGLSMVVQANRGGPGWIPRHRQQRAQHRDDLPGAPWRKSVKRVRPGSGGGPYYSVEDLRHVPANALWVLMDEEENMVLHSTALAHSRGGYGYATIGRTAAGCRHVTSILHGPVVSVSAHAPRAGSVSLAGSVSSAWLVPSAGTGGLDPAFYEKYEDAFWDARLAEDARRDLRAPETRTAADVGVLVPKGTARGRGEG